MSKGKRTKSGSAHDINKWENGLVQAVVNEDAWKTCVFFLISNKPEDNVLINISSEVISTGLRKLFSIISKEQLLKEVKDFAKAIGSGGGKGKPAVKLPEFVEICEQVKPFIDQGEDIPPSLLAKLLKFKLLLLKTKDIERLEEAKKEKAKSASGKKGDKRAESPGKRSKSPKKKGKKGEAERPPSPKKDTKLKRRGEVEDTFKTIDDEPDEEGSPQHYVLIHGFLSAPTLQHLANIGVHVNAIIKLQQDEYRTEPPAHLTEEIHEDVEAEPETGEVDEGVKDDEVIDESSKDEEELVTFWRESDELVLSAPTGHKLKDIAKYEVTVSNTLPPHQSLADVEAEKKTELGTAIFEKIANVCYDMLDHQKSYQRFLAAMKLLRIPVHTPSIKTDSQTAGQSAAVATDTSNQVEIDMRYYNHLVHSIPDESISVPLVLHCLVEQVVATVDETNPLAKQTETREDGLDNDLAAHINSKMADLALSSVEKQEILETDNVNKRREDAKVPVILEHNDKLSQRLHYLEDLSILDGLDTERTMLDTAAPRALDIFPRRTVTEFMESSARFHQFIQHCSFPSAENVSYLLKKYTFEGIPLKSVEATGNIVEPQQLDKKFSSYNNPWDDPYSDFSKYFNARDQGMINDDVKDLGSVSAAVRLVSFRNLDDWCYVEEFDRTTFTQVLDDARHSHPFVDTYYHKHDDTLLLVYHNPVGKQLQNTSRWNVRLLSDVGFRNYLEHISCMIHDWNLQQERIEEENNKTPTPVPPTPEPPQTEIKIGSRYGLKTRAEIAALKAEEEDKGKKKGKRSARSRTPKSGKKSAGEKKGSPSKNRTTSAATKGSKARLVHEVETQPEVDDQGAMDADVEYDFLGYDVGDDLIHVTGVQSSMFPCDGGEIRVEKTQYVRGPNFVSTSVHKDGNILKLHFLEPQEEILPEQPSNISVDSKAENTESREKTEEDVAGLNEPNDEGVEKSEFEANEKTASFHEDVVVESDKIPSEPDPPVFCTHASFVAQLNDGMVITCSGFGAHGKPGQQGEGADGEFGTGVPLDPSPPPKAPSPKSRKKNGEEARRLEELRLAEEKQRAEEEARRLKELQESVKKPFHEIFVSCPDGLHVSYRNDENYESVEDSGGVVVRQRYPFKSRGLHECEAARGTVAMREVSRSIKTDGTVIKLMLDNSIEILYPDGSTSTCPVYPAKSDIPTERPSLEPSPQQPTRKGQTNNTVITSSHDEADDQLETSSELSAQWTTVTTDGERLMQSLDGSERYLEAVKLSVAACPVTHQVYKTREDNVITIIRPDGTQIVEHSDGTRITTYYDIVRTEIRAADAETGEEAEYESHVCKHVKVECEGFATVVMETEHGCARTLFGNGSSINTEANGECVVEKSDGSKLCFDIKGDIAYVPRELSSCGSRGLSSLSDSCCTNHRGVYLLRTTSQHCCELLDQHGNVFSAYSNGEIKISESEDNVANISGNDNNEASLGVDALSSLSNAGHVPRFFVMRRDGTGYELLRHRDVNEYLKAAEDEVTTAVLRTPVEGLPGVTGITVLKPFSGGVGKTWMKEKDEAILIPVGLRERDFKMFPAKEFKKVGPNFGSNAGSGLNVGNMRKTVHIKPQITCPKVLVLRHLIQYEPSDSTHRQTISAAFQQYGDYVTKLQLQADGCLPQESRDTEEVERANILASKHEPVKSNKLQVTSNKDGLCQDYVKSVTPVDQPLPPAPVWKRSPAVWERDRIELAKLDYGKHALRYQEVPAYFETAQGQSFLTGLKAVPDMTKLSADLDKQACPARPPTDLESSRSSTPAETIDQNNVTQESCDRNDSKCLDRYSSAVLENLDPEGRNSPGDPPVQSSTPFASRPINPTPAQAAGRPTPTASRPTNPTPRQASNVIGSEVADSPRNVQSILDYTPLEALVETQNEVSTVDDNDTALDLMSSTNSQYDDDGRQKSLYVDVTGSPRKDTVRLPNVILGGKPGALPNTQFSMIEDPVRRKVQTVSVVGKNGPNMRGFELFPPEVDFGILKEGCTYIHPVVLKNIGIDSCRFKIRQPPPSTGMKVLFTPGPVAAGMNTKLDIEIFAVAVGVSGESGIGSIGHHIEIVGETDIIYLPVTATILTAYEYDNRSSSLPQGYHSPGTQMIANRPPSREAIRPQRDHIYSNVAKHF